MRLQTLVLLSLAALTSASCKKECNDADISCSVPAWITYADVCRIPYHQIINPAYAGFVQGELIYQASKGMTGTPSATTFGTAPGAAELWEGTVLAPNGKIYGIPNDATAGKVDVVALDPATRTFTLFTAPGGVNQRWTGGALAPDGKIYALPVAATTNVLVIDPSTNTASTFGPVSGLYGSAILAPNGLIYGLPQDGTQPAKLNTTTRTLTALPGSASVGQYRTGVLALNGKIYATWDGNGTSVPAMMEIDPATDTVAKFGPNTSGWIGAALAPDGKIYALPVGATQSFVVDPSTRSFSQIGAATGANAYEHNVTAPNGKVYGLSRGDNRLAEIDYRTTSVTFGAASTLPVNGYSGTLASDGNIYMLPRGSAPFGVIQTASRGTICDNLLLSSYFNKY